jgi:hypothetical protein
VSTSHASWFPSREIDGIHRTGVWVGSRADMNVLKKRIPCPCLESTPRSSIPQHCYYTEYTILSSTHVTVCNMQMNKYIHVLLLRWKILQFSRLAFNFSLTNGMHLPEFWIMKFGLRHQH